MTIGENKALVRRFYEEVWNAGNVEFAYHVFADDYRPGRWTAEQGTTEIRGRAEMR